MKNGMAWGMGLLAVALIVFGYLFYKSTMQAAQSLQSTTQGTAGINNLASQISNVLSSLGVKTG